MPMIEVRHLYKSFEQKGNTVEALRDICLAIEVPVTFTELSECPAQAKVRSCGV